MIRHAARREGVGPTVIAGVAAVSLVVDVDLAVRITAFAFAGAR